MCLALDDAAVAHGVVLGPDVSRHILDHAFPWHPLLATLQSPLYLVQLTHRLHADFLGMPSRSIYGRTSPRCCYPSDEAFYEQYARWYAPEMHQYLRRLNRFLFDASRLGYFPFFPVVKGRRTTRGENPVWDDNVLRTHRHRCKEPTKPSAHQLRLWGSV